MSFVLSRAVFLRVCMKMRLKNLMHRYNIHYRGGLERKGQVKRLKPRVVLFYPPRKRENNMINCSYNTKTYDSASNRLIYMSM